MCVYFLTCFGIYIPRLPHSDHIYDTFTPHVQTVRSVDAILVLRAMYSGTSE